MVNALTLDTGSRSGVEVGSEVEVGAVSTAILRVCVGDDCGAVCILEEVLVAVLEAAVDGSD